MNNDYRDYLEHHGIPGMKWGVRRYQNEDGSLTYKGKKRYARQTAKELNNADQERAVTAYKSARVREDAAWRSKYLNRLSKKKTKAESIRDDAETSDRKRARQEKKIDKISKKQERVKDILNKDLSEIAENSKKIKELENKIDKTISKLSTDDYLIRSVRSSRTVDIRYNGAGYTYYSMPGTYYSVKAKKNKS